MSFVEDEQKEQREQREQREQSFEEKNSFWSKISIGLLSLGLAILTVIVINI